MLVEGWPNLRAQMQVGGCALGREPLEGLFCCFCFRGHQVTVTLGLGRQKV